MKIVRIIVLTILLVLIVVLVGGFILYRDWTQGPLPQHDGTLTVAGLQDTVEIFRDEWGVPHIYASNAHDLFFGQGYSQAQDRWWQMEFSRHIARGSIQELTGRSEGVMGTDIFIRTLGFQDVIQRELAEIYDEELLAGLQAFADGVNAYILNRSKGDLALEYNLLGLNGIDIEVKPWTPEDTLLWGKVMSLTLSGNQGEERRLSQLYDVLGEELVNDWLPEWPYGQKPTIVWEEDLPITDATRSASSDSIGAGIVGLDTQLAGNFSLNDWPSVVGAGIGSNNWVAHGSITESEMPLLANDMHLGLEMPSIWYEIGLHCQPVSEACPYDVVGFTFSPSALVIAGHNANIAWGFTNVGPDTQDLYQIRINPDNELQYEWNGEWRDITIREETLNFGGGSEPLTIQVRLTHLGPIINDNQRDDDGNLEGFNNEDPLVLRWTALDPGTIFQAVMELNQAQNWDEFRAALEYWDTPSQNIVYADTEGNIGYQTPGRIPIRTTDHTGLLPVPGWTDEYEWLGFIPYDNLPRIFNPERGYISSANQALVPLEYYDQLAEELGGEFGADANYVIDRTWAYGYRGDRINQLLEELAPHSADTFRQIHGDNYNGSAAELIPFLADLQIEDAELAEARDWLLEWDFQMHMDSSHAVLYAYFWSRLVENLFNDQHEDFDTSGNNNDLWAAFLLMQEPENAWWDDAKTDDTVETRDEILMRSFQEAYNEAVDALGENRDEWRWGALHTITFVSTPLGESGISLIENQVNRGPFETSGTGNAINAMGWGVGSFETNHGPSERVIYDVGDWTRSLSIHPTGQSGHPASDHYDDMIDPWRMIEYKPMLWTRDQVEAAAASQLTLTSRE